MDIKPSSEKRFALLIDADNVSAKYIKPILEELSKYGTVTYKRIYGDWTLTLHAKWKDALLDNSITPIQQFGYTQGKNATDSAMIIDAMDILYTNSVEGFCIVSSDSDFTRLASRIRESGLTVIGMGEQKTPVPFRKACDIFTILELLLPEQPSKSTSRGKGQSGSHAAGGGHANGPTIEQVERAVVGIITDNLNNGKATGVGEVGSRLLKRYPDFDVRSYGTNQLTKLLGEFESVQIIKEGNSIAIELVDAGEAGREAAGAAKKSAAKEADGKGAAAAEDKEGVGNAQPAAGGKDGEERGRTATDGKEGATRKPPASGGKDDAGHAHTEASGDHVVDGQPLGGEESGGSPASPKKAAAKAASAPGTNAVDSDAGAVEDAGAAPTEKVASEENDDGPERNKRTSRRSSRRRRTHSLSSEAVGVSSGKGADERAVSAQDAVRVEKPASADGGSESQGASADGAGAIARAADGTADGDESHDASNVAMGAAADGGAPAGAPVSNDVAADAAASDAVAASAPRAAAAKNEDVAAASGSDEHDPAHVGDDSSPNKGTAAAGASGAKSDGGSHADEQASSSQKPTRRGRRGGAKRSRAKVQAAEPEAQAEGDGASSPKADAPVVASASTTDGPQAAPDVAAPSEGAAKSQPAKRTRSPRKRQSAKQSASQNTSASADEADAAVENAAAPAASSTGEKAAARRRGASSPASARGVLDEASQAVAAPLTPHAAPPAPAPEPAASERGGSGRKSGATAPASGPDDLVRKLLREAGSEGVAISELSSRVRAAYRGFKVRDRGFNQFKAYVASLGDIQIERRGKEFFARLGD